MLGLGLCQHSRQYYHLSPGAAPSTRPVPANSSAQGMIMALSVSPAVGQVLLQLLSQQPQAHQGLFMLDVSQQQRTLLLQQSHQVQLRSQQQPWA